MPRHLNFLDEIGEIKSLSHLVNAFKLVKFALATYLVQGSPSIEYICTTLTRKLIRGTRLMAVPNGKNQIYYG